MESSLRVTDCKFGNKVPRAKRVPLSSVGSCAMSTLDCSQCDNGYACGVCLNVVVRSECPDRWAASIAADCINVGFGKLCEGDGECGTSDSTDNCPSNQWSYTAGARDVYRRDHCVVTTPQIPAPSPPPPSGACSALGDICIAGSSCGMCLAAVQSAECPPSWQSDW